MLALVSRVRKRTQSFFQPAQAWIEPLISIALKRIQPWRWPM